VAVPFGCSPQKIQQALLKFIVDLTSTQDMHSVKKLFFVPVGLPGMGKSTLAKNIKFSIEKNLSVQSKANLKYNLNKSNLAQPTADLQNTNENAS